MITNRRDTKMLLDPWPLHLPKRGKYVWSVEPIGKALRYRSCWSQKHTVKWAAKKILNEDWLGKRHQIHSTVRHGRIFPKCFVFGNVVWDGNHTLCALYAKQYKGPILVIKYRRK